MVSMCFFFTAGIAAFSVIGIIIFGIFGTIVLIVFMSRPTINRPRRSGRQKLPLCTDEARYRFVIAGVERVADSLVKFGTSSALSMLPSQNM